MYFDSLNNITHLTMSNIPKLLNLDCLIFRLKYFTLCIKKKITFIYDIKIWYFNSYIQETLKDPKFFRAYFNGDEEESRYLIRLRTGYIYSSYKIN